jgi:endonuclease YncB( thermonuclease family)
MKITLNNYPNFLIKIQKIIADTESEIIANINRQKVEMCWVIGKNIEEYLLENNGATYGKKLFSQLAQDTGILERNLYRMSSFYKSYPTLSSDKNLNWSHYRSLISVKNDEQRQYFENLTIEGSLTARELQKEISQNKPSVKKEAKRKLYVSRGKLFNYKIAEIAGERFLDLGFNIFERVGADFLGEDGGDFEVGDVLLSSRKNPPTPLKGGLCTELPLRGADRFLFSHSTARRSELHTYKAHLTRIVDGDTIHVALDLGFNIFHKEILRLAKINAPEKNTAAGKNSTKKLTDILKNVKTLIIKTNKTDIYGRYVADIFLESVDGEYLNQRLVDEGLAEVF